MKNKMSEILSQAKKFIVKNKESVILHSVVFLLSVVVAIYTSSLFERTKLIYDDLNTVFEYRTGSFKDFMIGENSFRPVSNYFLWWELFLSRCTIVGIKVFNVLFFSAVITFVYYVFCYISKRRYLSIFFVCLIAISRLNWYHISQLLGTMELSCILFLAILILFCYKYIIHKDKRNLIICIVSFLMLILCHERFIVIGGPLIVLLIFTSKSKKDLMYPGICVLIILSNFLIKRILGIEGLQGTAGQAIEFDFKQFFSNLKVSYANLIGIPLGPDYLIGYDYNLVPKETKMVFSIYSILLCSLIVFVITRWIITIVKEKIHIVTDVNWIFKTLLILMILANSISTAITIRVEMRWIYSMQIMLYLVIIMDLDAILGEKVKTLISGYLMIMMSFYLVSNVYCVKNNNLFYICQWNNESRFYSDIILKDKKEKVIFCGKNVNMDFWDKFMIQFEDIEYRYVDSFLDLDFMTQAEYASTKFITANNGYEVIQMGTEMNIKNYWTGKEYTNMFFSDGDKIEIDIMKVDDFPISGVSIYINENLVYNEDDIENELEIILDIERGKFIEIKIVSKYVYVPKELGINDDIRELGLYIKNCSVYN